MKLHEVRARAVLQVHHVAADEARAVVGDRLDRPFELRRATTRSPGTIGAISTPALMPASTSSRTARSRCSGCAVPGSSIRQASSSTVGTLM